MDIAEYREKMQETNRRFEEEVVGRGNIAGLDMVYTAQARILPPGAEMIAGREAIKGFWQNVVRNAGLKKASLKTVQVEAHGDVLTEIGQAALVFQAPGQPASEAKAKYVVVWKQEDGAWKWHWDIWNT